MLTRRRGSRRTRRRSRRAAQGCCRREQWTGDTPTGDKPTCDAPPPSARQRQRASGRRADSRSHWSQWPCPCHASSCGQGCAKRVRFANFFACSPLPFGGEAPLQHLCTALHSRRHSSRLQSSAGDALQRIHLCWTTQGGRTGRPHKLSVHSSLRIVLPLSRPRASCRRADALPVADSPCHASSCGGKGCRCRLRLHPGSRCSPDRKSTRQRADGQQQQQQQELQLQQEVLRCCFSSLWRSPRVAPTRAAYLCNCSSHAAASSRWQVDAVARQRLTH
jgi:hypothetical protein